MTLITYITLIQYSNVIVKNKNIKIEFKQSAIIASICFYAVLNQFL